MRGEPRIERCEALLLVQFGAGNIGRSFMGQLFARAGYEVCFVDVVDALVASLNERREYVVEVRDDPPGRLLVPGVRAVHGRHADAVAEELVRADTAGTAVGPAALKHLFPTIARGLERRLAAGRGPLDIILCENLRNAAEHVREGLARELPPGFPLDEAAGLVETSIGKMVPLMTDEDRASDPLLVFAEAYNTLICDRRAFKCGVPQVPGLDPKDNMPAYVDRKLFVHNLGHATCAYVGFLQKPESRFIWEVAAVPELRDAARRAMWESGRALLAEYPGEFTETSMGAHIEDLLRRFGNRALGDTIYRVGRDVPRKLAGDDRLMGALRLDAKHGVQAPATCLAAACALRFDARDEHGEPYPPDAEAAALREREGTAAALRALSGLDPSDDRDAPILAECVRAEQRVREALAAGLPLVPAFFAQKGE